MNELKTMHLFAGVGGGILADLILGHRPVVAVEWDRYACSVLRERVADGWFDGVEVWEGDVREFAAHDYKGRVDCIHAGFPCQDISIAGSQAGVGEDTRSGLYRQVLRIADEIRPRYIFLENVAAIVTGDGGGMLRAVAGDITERGYDAVWLCLSAAEVGANHGRDRWWMLAYPKSEQCNGSNNESENRRSSASESGNSNSKGNVANSNGSSSERMWIAERVQARQLPNSGCTQEHQQRGWWQTEPDVGRVADGIPFTAHRLKGLGNAQVPLQAATAFKLLWEIKNDKNSAAE